MGRRIYYREPVQSFLIVCEGKETEPLYFRAFRVPGDVRNIDVTGLGKSTINLVKEAIKLKEKGDYNQVWVVFDIDDNSADQVFSAIHLANENGIEVAYSNQAFELWYLLHFHFHHTAIDRGQYIQKLSTLLQMKYEKTIRVYTCFCCIDKKTRLITQNVCLVIMRSLTQARMILAQQSSGC